MRAPLRTPKHRPRRLEKPLPESEEKTGFGRSLPRKSALHGSLDAPQNEPVPGAARRLPRGSRGTPMTDPAPGDVVRDRAGPAIEESANFVPAFRLAPARCGTERRRNEKKQTLPRSGRREPLRRQRVHRSGPRRDRRALQALRGAPGPPAGSETPARTDPHRPRRMGAERNGARRDPPHGRSQAHVPRSGPPGAPAAGPASSRRTALRPPSGARRVQRPAPGVWRRIEGGSSAAKPGDSSRLDKKKKGQAPRWGGAPTAGLPRPPRARGPRGRRPADSEAPRPRQSPRQAPSPPPDWVARPRPFPGRSP